MAQVALTDPFIGIAHPVRRKLLDALATGDQSVNTLAGPFIRSMSRPAISQHLRILLDAGLVAERRVGRRHIYHLRSEGLREVRDWLRVYDRFWQDRLSALGAYLDTEGSSGEV